MTCDTANARKFIVITPCTFEFGCLQIVEQRRRIHPFIVNKIQRVINWFFPVGWFWFWIGDSVKVVNAIGIRY